MNPIFVCLLKVLKEKRKIQYSRPQPNKPRTSHAPGHNDNSRHRHEAPPTKRVPEAQAPKLPASNLLNKLATINRRQEPADSLRSIARSSGFSERPPPQPTQADDDVFDEASASKRDERLALIEDLEPGPVEFTPPSDDPDFEKTEPNSGIRLS
jgi:minichromosome maintenance protein 10